MKNNSNNAEKTCNYDNVNVRKYKFTYIKTNAIKYLLCSDVNQSEDKITALARGKF